MKNNPYRRILAFSSFMLILIILFALTACQKQNTARTRTTFAFDTVITLTWFDSKDDEAIHKALAQCSKYESVFSRTDAHSELSALNQSGGKPFKCSDDLFEALSIALSYCEKSKGRFDITLGVISDAYHFSDENHQVPTESELSHLLSHTGYEKIHLNSVNQTVTVDDPELIIDLGAIAKGYIADRLKEDLVNAGVTSAIIDLGGNVLLIGEKPEGGPFHIGIQYPEKGRSDAITTVHVADQAVVTSGTYQRSFIQDGIHYHHLLDSSTGKPIRNGLLSVSIIAPDAVTADALSTTVFALGPAEGKALLLSLGLEGILIDEDFSLHLIQN